jgi:tetratricopeptide (TPR) repeat protein
MPEITLKGMEPQVITKIAELRNKVEADPAKADSWGRLGMNLYAHELLPAAATCFGNASKLDPEEIRWPYFCAITLYSLGKDEALDWFRRAVKLQPDNPQMHVRMGDAYLTEGNRTDASKHFLRALELDKNRADAHLGLAQIDYNLKKWEEAAARLEKAISLEPDLRKAHALLIACYRMLWQQDKVMEASRRLGGLREAGAFVDPIIDEMAREGVSIHWYMERGVQYLETRQPAAAAAELRRALEIRPDASVYSQLGIALVGLGENAEAISNFRKARELSPNSAMYTFNLGLTLCNAGDASEGLQLLEKACELAPGEQKYPVALFEQYVVAQRWSEALQLGTKAYTASPKSIDMGLKVAWILATCPRDRIRNGAKAVQIAEPIIRGIIRPHPEALDCLAAAYAEYGQYNLATETISKAIGLAESEREPGKVARLREREESYAHRLPWRSAHLFGH